MSNLVDNEQEEVLVDFVDLLTALFALIVIAATKQIALALFFTPIYIAQHYARRTKGMKDAVTKSTMPNGLKELILPPVTDKVQEDTPAPKSNTGETKRLTRLDEAPQKESMWSTITKPLTADDGNIQVTNAAEGAAILKRIPKSISYDKIPDHPSKLAVPLGYGINQQGKLEWGWIDFGSSVIHGVIAGQSGTGKDSILKLWFAGLTKMNKPHEVKFMILDGKGEWVIQPLINAQHMFYPPVGGIEMVEEVNPKTKKRVFVDKANERIEDAISALFAEMNNRTREFQRVGAANIERYREKTGLPLPYIIVFATDIGTNLGTTSLETVVNALISKGRSLGIRLILSMQTTSNQSTFWRSNTSLIMAGNVQLDSQDGPVLGIKVDEMIFRPSKLPNPKDRPGIYVVRLGSDQYLLQAPYMPDAVWEEYLDRVLPQKEPIDDLQKLLLEG